MNVSGIRLFSAALVPLFVMACDDGGSTGPGGLLTPDDVQGSYNICSLTFTPSASFLQAVDIRAEAFELVDPPTPPRLGLDTDRTFELDYTPIGSNTDRELSGTYELGSNSVLITFTGGVDEASLLLPTKLLLNFQESPRQLSTQASDAFNVARKTYADMADIPEEERGALSEQIRGTVGARLATGACG
ncbi:MAG TPA: hypothetical protein VFI91_01095 [Longimicrobiaceae bacterium]|nr:hypothetical protein [Longimicrobiaceae bacterium]